MTDFVILSLNQAWLAQVSHIRVLSQPPSGMTVSAEDQGPLQCLGFRQAE